MDHTQFETLKRRIAADATVDQLVDLEAQTARLLSERVSEALVARRSSEVAGTHKCPHCGSAKVVRHGRDRAGRQRFRCLKTDDGKGCGRTFNALTGTAFARMRKPELWTRYAAELARGTSLAKIVDDVGLPINRLTAWRWRHRLLAALEPGTPERLGGIVEVDETFFLRSFKGHRGWKRGQAPENRPPRYRGSGALLPGLSRQQVPILTGIDRNGCHVDAMLERRSRDQVIDNLGDVVEPGSVLCTDAFSAYEKLAERIGAEHRVFEPPKDDWLKKAVGHPPRRKGALGLGRVNAHHEAMKTLVNRRLRGVSTRYLPNYLVMLRLERRKTASPQDILQAIVDAR
jgi:transposase-like protein